MSKRVSFYDKGILTRYIQKSIDLNNSLENLSAVERFNIEAKERFCNDLILATCNSTAGLHLSLCALDLKRGDKVVCSVNAFADVPEVVRHFDAEPIFVDCEARTYNIDLDKLDETLSRNRSKKLRAVIISHIAGMPVDMNRVHEIAQKHKIAVIEDATDALGAKIDDKPLGCGECDMTVLSIGSKIDNRFDSGIVSFKSKECYDRAKLLINHGLSYENSELNYIYDIKDIGCQYRMNELEALYAIPMLEDVDKDIQRRREIADIYFRELEGLKHITLPIKDDNHIYTHYIIEIDKNRDVFAKELIKDGIEVGLNYMPLHLTRYYKDKYNYKIFDFPNALNIYQRILSLPIHCSMSNDDVYAVCEAVKKADSIHI